MYKRKITVLLLVLLIILLDCKVYSQTEQQTFESLVKQYSINCDVLTEAEVKYKETLETTVLEQCFNTFEEIKQSLLVLNSTTTVDSFKSPSAYYGVLSQVKQAHIQFNYLYDADKAYQMLKEIEVFFNGTKPFTAPFDYMYYGTVYSVTDAYTNKLKSDYHQLLGNVCNSLNKEEEMTLNFNKLLDLDKSRFEALPANFKKDYTRKETKRISAQKRENSNFNIYLGTYPLSLISEPDKRDYGAVLNLVTKKSAIEFSYLQVQQKKDYNKENLWKSTVDPLREMSLWDGFYSHVQYKQFGKAYGSTNYYQGFLLALASKNYKPMQVDVLHNQTSVLITTTFNPTEKQYIGMYNFGMMFLFKGIGVDAFAGLGGTYNLFDQGTTTDKTIYTIQNSSLQSKEPASFGLIFRIGVTVGLNIGNGNMR